MSIDITKPIKTITVNGDSFDFRNKNDYFRKMVQGGLSELSDPIGVVSAVGYSIFDKSDITKVDLPNCLTINHHAFNSCHSLSEVNLPKCELLNNGAFYNCIRLTSINAPNVTSVNANAFAVCKSLEKISLPNCTYLGSGVFASCSRLSSIYIPNVITLSSSVFTDCSKLESVVIPNCTSISTYCFCRCYALSAITAPNVRDIGINAFMSCHNLQTISLPNLITISAVFNYCYKLSEAYFENLERLTGDDAFGYDVELKCLSIPKVSMISGNYMFRECGLSVLSVPNLELLSGSKVFNFCKIEKLILGRSVTIQNANILASSPFVESSYLGYYASVYVPSEDLPWFKTAKYWSSVADRIVSVDELEG